MMIAPFAILGRTIAAAVAVAGVAVAQETVPAPTPAPTTADFIRARSEDGVTALEIAVRSYEAPADAAGGDASSARVPRIELAGVVHIGDRSYYDALVERFSGSEIVLYESVLPRGAFGTRGDDDLERQRRTQEAMLFLRGLVEGVAKRTGAPPVDRAALRAAVVARDSRLARPIDLAFTDGWGREIGYAVDGDAFAFCSLGADGARGGRDLALDLVLGPTRGFAPGAAATRAPERDLYRELAEALGVDLQVRSIDYDRPGWEPADLPMEELLDRLWRRGERSATLEMLSEQDGLRMRLVRFLLGFVSKSPAFKKTVIGALGSASTESGLGSVDRRIILDERNEAVLDEIARLLALPDPPASITVFYGAAHMPDFERVLAERHGYRATGEEWYAAMSVDEWSLKRLREAIARAESRLAELRGDGGDREEAADAERERRAADVARRLEAMRERLAARESAASDGADAEGARGAK
ncbi:MAG: hypothetical protein RI967_2054 [Planctomycetota bacterium]